MADIQFQKEEAFGLSKDINSITFDFWPVEAYLAETPLRVPPTSESIAASIVTSSCKIPCLAPADETVVVSRTISTTNGKDLYEYIQKYHPKIGIPEFKFTE